MAQKVHAFKYILFFLFLSVSNGRLLWFFNLLSPLSFAIGEFVVAAFLYSIFRNEEILRHFQEDHVVYHQELQKKVPVLKYELPLSLTFSVFMLLGMVYPNLLTFFLWMVSTFSYLFFLIYIGKKKYDYRDMLENYYNFPKKESLSLGKGSRSMGIISKMIIGGCVECAKYVPPLMSVVLSVGYMAPKVIYGFNYPPFLANWLGYYFTGLTASDEFIYSAGVDLIEKDPSLRPHIVKDDGHTIDPSKLFQQYVKLPLSAEARAYMEFLLDASALNSE